MDSVMIATVAAFVFGATTGLVISCVSGYSVKNWQWWAAYVPILITGMIYHFFAG